MGTADRRCGEATVVPRKLVEGVNAEKEVEVWPTQRKRTESREPDQVLHSVVSGAVPVWVSPRTLMPEGTVQCAIGRDHKVLG